MTLLETQKWFAGLPDNLRAEFLEAMLVTGGRMGMLLSKGVPFDILALKKQYPRLVVPKGSRDNPNPETLAILQGLLQMAAINPDGTVYSVQHGSSFNIPPSFPIPYHERSSITVYEAGVLWNQGRRKFIRACRYWNNQIKGSGGIAIISAILYYGHKIPTLPDDAFLEELGDPGDQLALLLHGRKLLEAGDEIDDD